MIRSVNLKRDEILRNEILTEENNDFLIQNIIQQYEGNYDDGVITNEQKRKFGEEGDIFYECEHCNALKIKKIKVSNILKVEIIKFVVVMEEN